MITEDRINNIVAAIDSESLDNQWISEQSDLWNYLNSDDYKALSEQEKQLQYLIISVVYYSIKEQIEDFEIILDDYIEYEEKNWTIREEHSKWATTVDVYFDQYEEEDLLAFVEDMLVPDEESDSISDIGREVIMVSAKTLIDLYIGS